MVRSHPDLAVRQGNGKTRVSHVYVLTVAIALLEYADHGGKPTAGGNIRPGHDRISRDTGISKDSVQRAIKHLVSIGVLIQMTTKAAPGHALTYQLAWPAGHPEGFADGSEQTDLDTVGAAPENGRSRLRAVSTTVGAGSANGWSTDQNRLEQTPAYPSSPEKDLGGPEQPRLRTFQAIDGGAGRPDEPDPEPSPVTWDELDEEHRRRAAHLVLADPSNEWVIRREGLSPDTTTATDLLARAASGGPALLGLLMHAAGVPSE